jgi:hypothetical protein
VNETIGPLAHLQIGRAYAMQGDIAKAKGAYQDFLTLWNDADPDIPILISAKAEYAKLNSSVNSELLTYPKKRTELGFFQEQGGDLNLSAF